MRKSVDVENADSMQTLCAPTCFLRMKMNPRLSSSALAAFSAASSAGKSESGSMQELSVSQLSVISRQLSVKVESRRGTVKESFWLLTFDFSTALTDG